MIKNKNLINHLVSINIFFIGLISMIVDPNFLLKIFYFSIFLIFINLIISKQHTLIYDAFKNLQYDPFVRIILIFLCIQVYYIAFYFQSFYQLRLFFEFFFGCIGSIILIYYMRFLNVEIIRPLFTFSFIFTCIISSIKMNIFNEYYSDPLRDNRLSVALAICSVPTLFLNFKRRHTFKNFLIILSIYLSYFQYLYFGYGHTAKLMFFVSIIAYLLFLIFDRKIFYFYIVIFTAILFAQPWYGNILNSIINYQSFPFLKNSAFERIYIWQGFGKILNSGEIYGFGFGNSIYMQYHTLVYSFSDNLKAIMNVSHPHNNFLQIWIELGLLGVFVFWMFLVVAAQYFRKFPSSIFGAAFSFLFSLSTACLVFDNAWPNWWIASIGLGVMLLALLKQKEILDNA